MRILLAEDETELGKWLSMALAQRHFQVDWVNDGRLVRRSLKATRYDALILDLGLPGLGGHEVLADCAKPTSVCRCSFSRRAIRSWSG